MTQGLRRTWYTFLDILFPPICLNCRSNLLSYEEKEDLLCGACFKGIKIYSNIVRPGPQFNLVAIGSYENSALRELLHYFKYNGFLAAQVPLEKLIVKWLEINPTLIPICFPAPEGRGSPNSWAANSCLVPIPLHRKRLRDRGFNQAEIIGEILSRCLNLPLERNLLERIRNTKSQIKMSSSKEREENLKNSIRIKAGEESLLSQYQSAILVDDIYTSGSTMREAVKALRRAGVKDIAALVIAKT